MLAFSYIRFSSKEQGKGHSLKRQIAAREAYCERHGITLDETLRLHDLGVSAYRGNNLRKGALGQFIGLVEQGRIPRGSILIVENIDRLSRDQVGEALQLFISLLTSGITLVTLEPERRYTADSINDVANLLEPLIAFSRAYEESKRKSDLVGKAWANKRERARKDGTKMTARCPYWLTLSEDRTRFKLNFERVAVVRRIFDLAEGGLGQMAIAATLNKEKVPPFTPAPWNVYYVGLILRNRAVIGEHQPNRTVEPGSNAVVPDGPPITNYYPSVIEPGQFHRVQAILAGRDRRTKNRGRKETHIVNIFRGIAFDARTGHNMHLVYVPKPTKADPTKIVYKMVPNKGYSQNASIKGGIRYDHVETAFLRYCRTELKAEDFLTRDDLQSEILELSGRLVELDGKIKAVQARIAKAENIEVYLDTLAHLDTEKKAVTARLEVLRSQNFNHAVTSYNTLVDHATALEAEPTNHELREKIRLQMRQLIEDIWILVFDTEGSHRNAKVQVNFHNGLTRLFWCSYALKKFGPENGMSGTVHLKSVNPSEDLRLYRHVQASEEGQQ